MKTSARNSIFNWYAIRYNNIMSTQRFKIVLLGEGRVGKTSILLRYTRGEYNDRQVSTLQASYLDKKIDLAQASVQLSIWDTAGQERFHALGPIYYRDAGTFISLFVIHLLSAAGRRFLFKFSFSKMKSQCVHGLYQTLTLLLVL